MNPPAAAAAQPTELSPVKRALLEIRELRSQLSAFEQREREPIAIVGLAVRAPGKVVDADSFAELLWSGRDAITEIPADRWSLADWFDENADAPGKMSTRHGGFIETVDSFDAEFFGISPLEAASMDPQQRLVLELAWEAIENAACPAGALAGKRAGIYLGIANGDYGRSLFARPDLIDPYFSSGNAFSVASGRLAYFLGALGPAISVDTACSSSLVALHLAVQGLRHGDCDVALSGGVNLILTPEVNINFSKASMMSPDGRCKTFDASADGYVRGEGGAFVVLRRLRDAQASGDRVLAVIRGTAINQDGRSNGLTAPNGPAQEAVIRAALDAAQIPASAVGYVEAHGTGTPLGDPIEVNALGAVFAEGRSSTSPLLLGSVKTNIGHLEAAAGIVGVVKTVLALQRGEVPPHLHLQQLNPYVDWSSLPIKVPTQPTPWPVLEGRRVAGVSSFGFSGTNAHIVLEAAPAVPTQVVRQAQESESLLLLSARDSATLAELARQYARMLDSRPYTARELADVCYTAAVGRTHFAHRLAVRSADAAGTAEALRAFVAGQEHAALFVGDAVGSEPRVAFLFPGQGPQYAGMARALYESTPAFRNAFDRCAAALDPLLGLPLRSVIYPEGGNSGLLDETAYAQPAMFAIEVALAALWTSWGVEPAAVMGHSFGEYAAAHVAGAIPLADAARMVAARGRLVQPLPRTGAMTVIEGSEADIQSAISAHAADVAIAAVNGATNCVISGEAEIVDRIAADFAARGARTKRLRVSHAFHSPLIESVLPAFEQEVSATVYSEPRTTLISNLSGRVADVALIGRAAYWRDHMRQPVRFADSVRALAQHSISHYIEMSPQPVLLGMAADCTDSGVFLASLREGQAEWSTLLESLQSLYCAGATINWPEVYRAQHCTRVALPTYPFRRKRHWIDASREPVREPDTEARWIQLLRTMDREAERGPLNLNAESYPEKWSCLAKLTGACAVKTFRDLGLFIHDGEDHSVNDILAQTGIAETYRHLIRRWLDLLVDHKQLVRRGSTYYAQLALAPPDLGSLWFDAERLFVDNRPLFAYVRHCAGLLGAVLTGRESPLETLFPGGSFELARGLYEQSSTMLYVNGLAAAAFESLGAGVGAGRTLRVMEVGAGTGGTTSALLPTLDERSVRYRFTDVSDAFLAQARERFGSFRSVEFGLFDLEIDPVQQGYAAGSFDVLVSANCVHAAKDLRAAIHRLLWLLAPGGVLVLIESTVHLTYFDMTTGLIEGWQHFTDDLRGDNPLLPPETWTAALKEAGFVDACAWPGKASAAAALGQHLIIARAPGSGAAGSISSDSARSKVEIEAETAQPQKLASEWPRRIAAATPAQRGEILIDLVRAEVARVLRLSPEDVPGRSDRLMDLGMDSLMAVQLRNGLNQRLQLQRSLPSTLMFDYPTISAIAGKLQELLADAGSAPAAAQPATATEITGDANARQAQVAAMSDDEIGALLLEKLGGA